MEDDRDRRQGMRSFRKREDLDPGDSDDRRILRKIEGWPRPHRCNKYLDAVVDALVKEKSIGKMYKELGPFMACLREGKDVA